MLLPAGYPATLCEWLTVSDLHSLSLVWEHDVKRFGFFFSFPSNSNTFYIDTRFIYLVLFLCTFYIYIGLQKFYAPSLIEMLSYMVFFLTPESKTAFITKENCMSVKKVAYYVVHHFSEKNRKFVGVYLQEQKQMWQSLLKICDRFSWVESLSKLCCQKTARSVLM